MEVTEHSFIQCMTDAQRLRRLCDRWLLVLEYDLDVPLPAWERAQLWRELQAASLGKTVDAVAYPDRPRGEGVPVDERRGAHHG